MLGNTFGRVTGIVFVGAWSLVMERLNFTSEIGVSHKGVAEYSSVLIKVLLKIEVFS